VTYDELLELPIDLDAAASERLRAIMRTTPVPLPDPPLSLEAFDE
jgi:hypothetical protein